MIIHANLTRQMEVRKHEKLSQSHKGLCNRSECEHSPFGEYRGLNLGGGCVQI